MDIMRLLDVFGLKNYRVFDNEQGFLKDFTSINLLTGINNSGKSSIVKALQMLKNSVNESEHPFSLNLNQQEHLLGDFDNLLFNKDEKNIEITLPYTFFGLTNFSISLLFESQSGKAGNYNAVLREFKVIDKEDREVLFSFLYRIATSSEETKFEEDHKKNLALYEEKLDKHKNSTKGNSNISGFPTFNNFPFFEIRPTYSPLVGYVEWSINLSKIKDSISYLKPFFSAYVKDKTMWRGSNLEKLDKRSKQINIIASLFLKSFKNDVTIEMWDNFINDLVLSTPIINGKEPIGMNHFMSEEDFAPPPNIEDILFYTAKKILVDNVTWTAADDDRSKYPIIGDCFLNSWNNLVQRILNINFISTIKEENSRRYNASSNSPFIDLLKRFEASGTDSEFFKKYLKVFEIGKSIEIEIAPKYQSILVSITTLDGVKRDLVDYGYGIKQLVLILMQISVLAHENSRQDFEQYGHDEESYYIRYIPSLLIIEEPESNLHPKWQSLLADMFAEASNKFNIQMIIETHSEYLIRKFQTLVANKQLDSKDVKILYLRGRDKVSKNKRQIEDVNFQVDGSIDFKIFDGGFFDENYELELSLLNIQRDNFLSKLEEFKKGLGENEDIIIKLQAKIDVFLKERDVAVYRQSILSRFDTSKLSRISIDYLISGDFLLNTSNDSVDYSPVIIQYGRVIENELKQIFKRINPKLSFGEMQGAMEKELIGFTRVKYELDNSGLKKIEKILKNKFKNPNNLKVNLLNYLRENRNSAAHPGQTKTKKDALDYIQKANEFLNSWILEKK